MSDTFPTLSPALSVCTIGALATLACIGIFGPPPSVETHSSMIHTHGVHRETSSEASKLGFDRSVDLSVPEPPATEAASAPTGQTYEVIKPDPPSRLFDDRRPDMMSGRETALARWTTEHAELWGSIDPQVQNCVFAKYVNVGDNSPDRAIDECLTFFEGQP